MTVTDERAPSRLAPADMARAAGIGLRTRRLRSVLSGLGIMIGIGAMVAVLGLSESSKSELLSQLDALGTNMLQVQASSGIGLGPGTLHISLGQCLIPFYLGFLFPRSALCQCAALEIMGFSIEDIDGLNPHLQKAGCTIECAR